MKKNPKPNRPTRSDGKPDKRFGARPKYGTGPEGLLRAIFNIKPA